MKSVLRTAAALLCLHVTAAHAAETTPSASPPPAAVPKLSSARRAVAVGTAVAPGVLVHGMGHFVAKQPKTGRVLLAVGSGGLGVALASVVGIALTGASRRTTAPFAAGMVIGIGAFTLSFLADLYGVAAPADARGAPLKRQPWFVLETGLLYRYDQQFAGRAMFHQAIEGLVAQRHHARLEIDSLPGDPSLRARGVYGYRALRSNTDGSYLALEGGALHQRFPNHGFMATTFEAAVRGRYDLARVGPTLRGLFVEGRAGAGISALRSRNADTDADELLLLRWSMGAYLGKGRGEVEAYYDHRRDTYAGGLLLDRGRSGYAGFVGAKAHWYFTDRIGILGEAQVGSALLTGVSLLIREGAR